MQLSDKQKAEGWRIVKFGDVAREVAASTRDPLGEGIERYVGLEHIDPESLRLARYGLIAEDNPTFTKKFSAGDILFGRRRAYLKKAAVADFDGICSGDITVIAPKGDALVPGLLPFIVQSDSFFDWAVKHSAGGLSPRTKFKSLAEFEFLLPPIVQQEKITTIHNKIEEIKITNNDLLQQSRKILSTAKNNICNLGYNHIQLKKVSIFIRNGFVCSQNSYNEGIPVSRIETISSGKIDFERIGYSNVEKQDYLQYKILKGDILLSHINSLKHIGKVAFFDDNRALYHAMNLMMIRPSEKINSKFLFNILSSAKAKRYFESRAKPAVNQASINKSDIENFSFPLPPLDEQKKIVSNLEVLNHQAKVLEQKLVIICRLQSELNQYLMANQIK